MTEEPENKIKHRSWPWRVVIAAVALLAVVGFFSYKIIVQTGPFPKSVTKNINFQLYYPRQLPSGYQVDKSSFKNPEQGIVTFNVLQPSGPAIGVTEQGVPPDLNLNQNTNAPAGVRLPITHFTTALGQATIDQWGDKKVCYIVAGQTWIIMNVTGVKDDNVRQLARSFTLPK